MGVQNDQEEVEKQRGSWGKVEQGEIGLEHPAAGHLEPVDSDLA